MYSSSQSGNQHGNLGAGLDRQEAENEEFSRGRTSDPLGAGLCAWYREVNGEP